MIYKLKNTIQKYKWGSTEYIQKLLNLNDNTPMAELWMGAHPSAPSLISDGNKNIFLPDFIKENPEKVLGEKTANRFNCKLPFLFKVLAAGKPLSIQSHPDKKQAEFGFKNENEKNIPLAAFNRNYKDDNHKPELICALTDFRAMRGFRPINDIADELVHLKLKAISATVKKFINNRTSEGLKMFFYEIMSMGKDKKKELVNEVLLKIKNNNEPRYDWIRKLNSEYPDDIGVICPLILNIIKLENGQAMYIPAGELHSYLSGTGMEIMANSDNVLRGGLTPKHVDVNELLKTLTFRAGIPEIIIPAKPDNCEEIYNSPANEFKLSRIIPDNEYTNTNIKSIEIIIIIKGECIIRTPQIKIKAERGDSFVIEACTKEYSIKGECIIYKASV